MSSPILDTEGKMDYRIAIALDNWITGHYGEDQVQDEDDRFVEDEGYGILESAAAYLSRDDYPDWDVSDALDVIRACQFEIEEDYA